MEMHRDLPGGIRRPQTREADEEVWHRLHKRREEMREEKRQTYMLHDPRERFVLCTEFHTSFFRFFVFFFLFQTPDCVCRGGRGEKKGRKKKANDYVASIMNLHSISRDVEGGPARCRRETGGNTPIWSVYRPPSLMTYHIQECVDHFPLTQRAH